MINNSDPLAVPAARLPSGVTYYEHRLLCDATQISPIITLLNSNDRLRVFTVFHGFTAGLNFILSIFFIQKFGAAGDVMSSVITILLLVLMSSIREMFFVLRGARKS